MKVVFATGIFPPDIGGPANSVSMLADFWSKQGHEVEVVTYSDIAKDDVTRGYTVRRIPRAQSAWRRYAAFFAALWSASGQNGPIFAQDAIASGLPALLVATLRRRRLIIRVAGDFAWEHAQVGAGYQGTLEEFQTDRRISPFLMLLRAAQRFVYRRADRVIVPSHYLAGVARVWGVREARIRVIYNGVDMPKFETSEPRAPHRIVAAGRLVPWKNFDVLIKAMPKVLERFPDALLRILGDGPEDARLRALADAPMLSGHIEFTGRVPMARVGQELAAAGIHALVSSYEGFSHQLVAGFYCGAPTIASRAGGNTELVRDGQNGLLVDPGDVDGLATALVRFMDDPAFAQRCAEEAKRNLERFSTEAQIAETTETILGSAVLRVLLVSRDPSVMDPTSSAAVRMRAYAEKTDALEIVALGRVASEARKECQGYHARVVDARHGPVSLLAFMREAARAAKDVGATLVVAQDPFEAGLAARHAAVVEKIPYLLEDHGAFYDGEAWASESALNRLRARVGRRVVRGAWGVRAVSARAAAPYKAMGFEGAVAIVPVGMHLAHGSPEHKTEGPFTLLYAGRYGAEKNLLSLIEAFSVVREKVPDAQLLLCGEGPEEGRIRDMLAAHDLTRAVRMLPWTNDMASVYAQADVAVLPSKREGYGRFVAEAMSYGLPIVMTDVGLAREVVRNGTEGYVVPVDDTALLAEALVKMAKEPDVRRLFRAAAQRRAQTLPKPSEVVERVTRFWKSAIGSPISSSSPASESEG